MAGRPSSRRALRHSSKRPFYSFLLLFCVIFILILRRPKDVTFNVRVEAGISKNHTSSLLLITVSNWMYREFLANFACNIHHVCNHLRPIVYSLDRRTHAFAATLGLSSVLLTDDEGDDVSPGSFERHGPRSFDKITKNKFVAVRKALESGLNVLLSDADMYWCSDATIALERLAKTEPYSDADILIQPEAKYRTLNSGFYYVRSTPHTLKLFHWLIHHSNIGAHDQDVVNKVFCDPEFRGKRIDEPYDGVPYYCKSHGVRIRALPSALFPSGAEEYDGKKIFSYSRKELSGMCADGKFVVLHNNFIRANKKKARLIQKGMWFISFNKSDEAHCERKPVPPSDTAARTCGVYC